MVTSKELVEGGNPTATGRIFSIVVSLVWVVVFFAQEIRISSSMPKMNIEEALR
jgi:hypothetical protein